MAPRNYRIDFDYSSDEWARIFSAVAKVRQEPLSELERDALRITADDYLHDQATKRAGTQSESVKRRCQKAWEKVGSKVEELKGGIEQLAAHHKEPGLFLVTEEMLATLQVPPPPQPYDRTMTVNGIPYTPASGTHFMSAGEMCKFLSQVKIAADRSRIRLGFGPAYCWSSTGRLEPRVPYMQQILWLWTHRFGGKLTLSVDSTQIHVRVYGPLVDYVAAVAEPIMKQAAPKPSAMRDVIERQKKFYAWLSGYERKWGEIRSMYGGKFEGIGPWAYNRAEGIRERMREDIFGHRAHGDVEPPV